MGDDPEGARWTRWIAACGVLLVVVVLGVALWACERRSGDGQLLEIEVFEEPTSLCQLVGLGSFSGEVEGVAVTADEVTQANLAEVAASLARHLVSADDVPPGLRPEIRAYADALEDAARSDAFDAVRLLAADLDRKAEQACPVLSSSAGQGRGR